MEALSAWPSPFQLKRIDLAIKALQLQGKEALN
jgi:hypothetical protein